tara:strand:+ start:903 stop:2210 length:1308 start_codon:yes stop_codon:yes gene_type:complete
MKTEYLEEFLDDATVGFVGSMSKLFTTEGIPLLRGKNIKPYAIDYSDLKFIDSDTHLKWKKSSLAPGDVVLVRVGIPGTCCVIPENIGDINAASLVILRPNTDKLDPYYLSAYLNSLHGRKQIESLNVGSVQSVLNVNIAKKIKIPNHSLEEQKKISRILNILNSKIEVNQKMNETLEEIAKTLFKSWFVDFDPVREKAEGRPTRLSKEISDLFPDSFEDSELGQMPEGFKVDSVDNQYDISIGKTPPRKEPQWFSENQQDIPWVSIKDMGHAGVYINKTSEFLTKEAIEKFNIHVIPKNNVILSFKLTVGRVAILQKDMCTNEAIAHFVPKDDDLSEVFTYCLLKSIRYESLSSTSSIATAVNSKIIKAMKCIFPSKALLIAFNEFCHPIYKKIETNINEIETLLSLRDALLPKLISGELKIPDAENFIEEAGI